MWYVKNVPNWERALRIVAGLAVAAGAILRVGGSTGWIVAAAAAGIVVSGLVGYCPACAMIGRRITK
ncbi:MAG: DUF2892 domain-containing protein [Burkholderiales bacterium]|nr:DUF2892 domain-containing protein [Burkholderiales bacterium]